MKLRTMPIFFAFFVMGFVDAVGTLVGFAKEEYQLSGFMAGLLPFFGFIAFALFSVPGGVLMDKKGKKFLMLLSLAIVLVGEALPALTTGYVMLVAAIFLIGVGMTLLQVAGNPIMRDVSEAGRFARNLTFAQFIKGLGSIAGPAVAIALVSRGLPWNSIFTVFGVVVAITLAGVAFLKVDEKKEDDKPAASIGSSFALLGEPVRLRHDPGPLPLRGGRGGGQLLDRHLPQPEVPVRPREPRHRRDRLLLRRPLDRPAHRLRGAELHVGPAVPARDRGALRARHARDHAGLEGGRGRVDLRHRASASGTSSPSSSRSSSTGCRSAAPSCRGSCAWRSRGAR